MHCPCHLFLEVYDHYSCAAAPVAVCHGYLVRLDRVRLALLFVFLFILAASDVIYGAF